MSDGELQRASDESIIMVTIGGTEYPMKHSPSCRVCTSPYRLDIERALVAGHSYKNIVSNVVEGRSHDGEAPDTKDLSRHLQRQHLPLPDVQKRALIERRAQEIGRSVEEGQELLLDYVGVNESIIQQGFQDLQSGKLDLKASDLINALKLQHQIDADRQTTISDEVWYEAMTEYMEVARRLMPEELWQEFGHELENSPVLQSLAAKIRENQAKREIED